MNWIAKVLHSETMKCLVEHPDVGSLARVWADGMPAALWARAGEDILLPSVFRKGGSPPLQRSNKIVPVGGGAGEAQKWGNHSSNKHQGLQGRREERVVGGVVNRLSNLLLCNRQHLIAISSMPCWSGRQGAWTKKYNFARCVFPGVFFYVVMVL